MRTNRNHLRRIEKVEEAFKPAAAAGTLFVYKFCDVPNLATAIAKAGTVGSRCVTFVPLTGPVQASRLDESDSLQSGFTVCFEGPQPTGGQVTQFGRFLEAEKREALSVVEQLSRDWKTELGAGRQRPGGESVFAQNAKSPLRVFVDPSELPQPRKLQK